MTLLDPKTLTALGELSLTLVDRPLDPRGDLTGPEVLIELSLDLQECCLEVNKFGINSLVGLLMQASAPLRLLFLFAGHPDLPAQLDVAEQGAFGREERGLH